MLRSGQRPLAPSGALRTGGVVGLVLVAACSMFGSSLDGFHVDGAPSTMTDCPAGAERCGDLCVDLSSNPANCGACGHACGSGEACRSRTCQVSCPGGQAECGGKCFELSNDPRNCGACGKVCATGEVCGNGQCSANCPAGQTNCGGSCADLQTDSKHCGACPTACSDTQECSAGQCVIACKTQLNQAITDPWGWSWDGLERASTGWTQAQTTCEAFRGRLPTASELYRVSAVKSATVGQTIHTNFLWSRVPFGSGAHVRVRLSDANISQDGDGNSHNFRCVCPPPPASAFVGNNCYGPVGTPCYGLGKYDLDTEDRAALHKGGAIFECQASRGHLASPIQLTEAIQQGIGNGSGQWLHTSDEVRYDLDAVLSWTTPATFSFRYTGNPNALSWSQADTFRPFRCAGVNLTAGTHPATVPDEFVGPVPGYKGETKDTAAAAYAAAADACWARGGHLPTTAEIAELVLQGLPAGSGTELWTSDQTGYNGTNFTVSTVKWTGTVPALRLSYPADVTWIYKHQGNPTRPFRCIYYPVDTTYTGPAASSCSGGCTQLALPGTSGAKMWLDSSDRAGALAGPAIDTCRNAGGHLATERDLTEAIRHGLPNGSGAFIFTADPEIGTSDNLLMGVVKWTGSAPGFDDSFPNFSTWDYPYNAHAFRCVWTNELR